MAWPLARILIGADDAIHEQRWTPRSAKALFPITLIKGVSGLLEPPSETFYLFKHGLAWRAAKDPLVDQDACNRAGARDR